jgi:hypothetical protein
MPIACSGVPTTSVGPNPLHRLAREKRGASTTCGARPPGVRRRTRSLKAVDPGGAIAPDH